MLFYKGCTKLLNVYWYRDYSIVRPILLSLFSLWPWQIERFSLSKLFEIIRNSRPQGRSFQTAQFRDTRVEFRANLGSLAERRGKWNLPKYRKMTAPCETSKDPFRNAPRTHPIPIPTVRGCSLTSRRFAFILFSHELREGRTKLTLPAGETYILEWEMCGCLPPRWSEFLPFL